MYFIKCRLIFSAMEKMHILLRTTKETMYFQKDESMFTKWIVILLKFFNFCGFHTEFSDSASHKKLGKRLFLIHIIWAIAMTYFAVAFTSQALYKETAIPYVINLLLQLFNGILTHWLIIVESYKQRSVQRKFWQIYEHIKHHNKYCKRPALRFYSISFVHYCVVVIGIQLFFLSYYLQYVANNWYFRLSYLVTQMSYHYRVFYYIFFLELIKFELKIIKNELKDIAVLTNFHSSFIRRANQRTKQHRRYSCCTSAVNCVNENNLKRINAYCQLVNELSRCLNQVFGLSHFATILYCFHMPLTDANWALWELDQRPWDYIFG